MKLIEMKVSKTSLINMAFLVVLFILPSIAHAQPVFTDDTSDVPLDGGLTLLVAAGIGYGAKKIRKKKENLYR